MCGRWLGTALVLLAAGCGGGSGDGSAGGGSTDDPFVGDYGVAGFEGVEASAYGRPRTFATASWGTLSADGAGVWVTNGSTLVDEGGLGMSSGGSPEPYRFDELFGLERSTNVFGPLRRDGAVGVSIQLTPPGLEVFARLGGALEPGDYGTVMFGFTPGGDFAFWGTLTVAPGGALTDVVLSSNTNGTLSLDVSLPDGSWTTTADGAITLALGSLELAGYAGADSRVAVFGGHAGGTNVQVVGAFVRLAGGATVARFDGEYAGVKIVGPLAAGASPAWSVNLGRLRADGAGFYQESTGVGSMDGRFLPGVDTFSVNLPYTVAANGAMTAYRKVGFVSADGRTVLLAGRVESPLVPTLGIFVR